MQRRISLADYVKKRNGVALAARYSMRNMLFRSFGASSFAMFWRYWNPIWGFYLSRYVMKPLRSVLPHGLAVITTFAVSGTLHDLAISVVKWQLVVLFLPWFTLMGVVVLCSSYFALFYRFSTWLVRAAINLAILVVTFLITTTLLGLVA